MTNPTISLILAMASNGTIGHNNRMPWHLPNDLQFFKKNTLGKPVIMGRKTYESIGKPLPERENLIISNTLSRIDGCHIFPSLTSAIAYADTILQAKEIMIMGGAKLYQSALPLMNRLYLTRICAEIDGDTQMQPFDLSKAIKIFEEDHQKDEKNPYDYTFEIWDFPDRI